MNNNNVRASYNSQPRSVPNSVVSGGGGEPQINRGHYPPNNNPNNGQNNQQQQYQPSGPQMDQFIIREEDAEYETDKSTPRTRESRQAPNQPQQHNPPQNHEQNSPNYNNNNQYHPNQPLNSQPAPIHSSPQDRPQPVARRPPPNSLNSSTNNQPLQHQQHNNYTRGSRNSNFDGVELNRRSNMDSVIYTEDQNRRADNSVNDETRLMSVTGGSLYGDKPESRLGNGDDGVENRRLNLSFNNIRESQSGGFRNQSSGANSRKETPNADNSVNQSKNLGF